MAIHRAVIVVLFGKRNLRWFLWATCLIVWSVFLRSCWDYSSPRVPNKHCQLQNANYQFEICLLHCAIGTVRSAASGRGVGRSAISSAWRTSCQTYSAAACGGPDGDAALSRDSQDIVAARGHR